ncbi:Sorting nexin-6 [Echinococcus granulosus]|uniref:Sorting nexin 6 n=1 Tax=Echinococcus granulosus TaxID=6210 RepID=A0A068WW65_ECHGR|nr:Sorting nexin-6 [Echinococcus granulosus]CDS24090.1 sorting nexin 6 [Echinococcus granulosus]
MASDFADPSTFLADTVPIGGASVVPQGFNSQSRIISDPTDNTSEYYLHVEISDALSNKDFVSFTVRTKTNLPEFKQQKMQVNRIHDDFMWLHDQLEENEAFAGFIVPPAPPRPDFDSSRAKLQRLGKSEGTMTKQDMQKLKAELEAEYLANFKKTVAMHQVFLQRIANHPVLRNDYGFRVFLEYEQELSVRTKNAKEKAVGFLKSVTKTADENLLLSNQREDDPFFREEKSYLVRYYNAVHDAYNSTDAMCRNRRLVGESVLRLELLLQDLATTPPINFKSAESLLTSKLCNFFGAFYPLQMRVTADEDLKLTDTLAYYSAESAAARDLLYRRSRALADYAAANRALDRARAKQRDITAADEQQAAAHKRFTDISQMARREIEDFKVRRIKYFQENLVALAELQIKHAKACIALLQSTLAAIKPITYTTTAAAASATTTATGAVTEIIAKSSHDVPVLSDPDNLP